MKKYSIWQIYISLFIFLIFIGVIFIASLSLVFYRLSVNNMIKDQSLHIQILANTIGSPFWVHQELQHIPGTIENFLSQSLKRPEILFIRIINAETGIIEKSGDRKENGMKADNIPIFEEKINVRKGVFNGESIKEISLKIKGGDNLWMGISLKSVRNYIILAAIFLIEGILTIFFVAGLAIFLISHRFIIKPLALLGREFGKLKKRNYDIFFEQTNSVEMEKIFQSFKKTAEELKSSHEKLRKSNWAEVKALEEQIGKLENEIYDLKKVRINLEEKLKKFM